MDNENIAAKTELVNRSKEIFKTSIVGIVVNLLLVGFKAAIGLITNSIAIVLDAINNLSDALSSVITIVGMKLAGKSPDKKHPMGYGRIEYLTSAIISVIVLYAGVSSLVSSVKQIIHPEKAEYSTVSLIIVGVAVFVKLGLGLYVKKKGKQHNSDALVASGTDALFDSIISASTLVAAIIFIITKISLESYLGVIISVIIIKSGIDILRETLSKILGEREDAELTLGIKQTVRSIDGVRGAYDLVLNNYGPDSYLGSVHIEVPDYFTAAQIDALTREIQREVMKKHNIYMSAVGIYSYNTGDDEAAKIRDEIEKIVFTFDKVIQVHGFYLDSVRNTISLDIVADFGAKYSMLDEIKAKISKAYPDYSLDIAMDTDISD